LAYVSSWSPDGRSLLIGSDKLVIVDVETGDTTKLPWAIDGAPSWQRVAAD